MTPHTLSMRRLEVALGFRLLDVNGFEFPDVLGVFGDRPVARELADAGGVHDRHFCPAGFVEEGLGDQVLCIAVSLEVREAEEGIVVYEVVA